MFDIKLLDKYVKSEIYTTVIDEKMDEGRFFAPVLEGQLASMWKQCLLIFLRIF